MPLSASGEQVFVYTAASTFVHGLNYMSTSWDTTSTSATTSALPAALVDGYSAVSLEHKDNYIYSGLTTGTKEELLSYVNDAVNWRGDNSRSFGHYHRDGGKFAVQTPPPSAQPSALPTRQSLPSPSGSPALLPTTQPNAQPTLAQPTLAQPTLAQPTQAQPEPTTRPTVIPTYEPTLVPLSAPAPAPTGQPTPAPTALPIQALPTPASDTCELCCTEKRRRRLGHSASARHGRKTDKKKGGSSHKKEHKEGRLGHDKHFTGRGEKEPKKAHFSSAAFMEDPVFAREIELRRAGSRSLLFGAMDTDCEMCTCEFFS